MGEEIGVEGSAGGIRGPPGRWKAFRDRAGGTLGGGAGLDRRGGDRGKGSCARSRGKGGLAGAGSWRREGTGWPGEKVC